MTDQTLTINDAALQASVQQFYARHMQLLDDGRIAEWAEGFTEDGIFAADAHPVVARGRHQIIAGATRISQELREQGIARRHWLGMAAIGPADEGIRVRCYALTYQITVADGPSLRSSNTCEDLLVSDGGDSWLIKERVVRQDLPA